MTSGTSGTSGPPELRIAVDDVRVAEFAALPTLEFGLTIHGADGVEVRSVVLSTQIRIAATRRTYDGPSQARLAELFGAPEQWSRNLSSLLWTQTVTQLPAFTGSTTAAVPVTCTYDFEVAVAKYFHGVGDGEIPLEFLFSGTTFYLADGRLQAARIAWDTEAEFRMPVRVWKDLMDHYFPASAWLRLGRDAFDRLYAYRSRHTLTGWDDVVESLLKTGGS
ncbi:DUF6084 family protein [Nonomuraea sp. NPDC048916]|uniref:DUF6084 family protein n=1 Tax=Nonomuraea sp. NPDC048916 TaxID=3154232 RepID=UPI0033D99816